MKTIERVKRLMIVATMTMGGVLVSNAALACDATVWGTAAQGSTLGSAFINEQSFIGTSTSAKICGNAHLPCNIGITLLVDYYSSTAAKCTGIIEVLGPDPLFPTLLPDNILSTGTIQGPLNLVTGVGSGTVVIHGVTYTDLQVDVSLDKLFIAHDNATAYESNVLRVQLTL